MFTAHKNIISLEQHYQNILNAFTHDDLLLGYDCSSYITMSKLLHNLRQGV